MGAATLIAARLLQFSGALVLFGSALFYLYGFDYSVHTVARAADAWQRRTLALAAAIALIGSIAWIMAETASLSGDAHDAMDPAALWTVLVDTHFGRACAARIALLAVSLSVSLTIQRSKLLWIAQAILGSAVIASFAWTGHGAMDRGLSGALHLDGDLLHLFAAALWIGALLPLAILVLRSIRSQALDDARAVQFGLDRFSAIGIAVITTLVISGIINSAFLIGLERWRALFTSPYGVTLLIKLALFGLMLALAALNRYRLTPALGADVDESRSTETSLLALRRSVLLDTTLAILVLLAVSLLGTLPPPSAGE